MREKLLWIIDRKRGACGDEDEYRQNRDFVHSLGLKYDIVGWCNYDLDSDGADDILDSMEKYTQENQCYLRGFYERTYPLENSEWYKLHLKYLYADYIENEDEIRAYKIPKNIHCLDDRGKDYLALVSEEFREICTEEKFTGVRFKWMKDIGKYKSQQYFSMYLDNKVPFFYSCNNCAEVGEEYKNKLCKLGGMLPRLANMFYNLHINVPVCIKKSDLPDTDFSYYKYDTRSYVEIGVLIRKRVADILLQKRVITKSDLVSISVLEEIPSELKKYTSQGLQFVTEEDVYKSLEEYEAFLEIPKQERKTSEKMALQMLRKQKKEEKEYYNKSLPKRNLEELIGTIYETMIPYYKICDGGVLSDEYTLLSYKESIVETEDFQKAMNLEEWLEPIEGILVAKSADGDSVVLTNDKQVKRISHEDFSVIEVWDNVESFIYEAF